MIASGERRLGQVSLKRSSPLNRREGTVAKGWSAAKAALPLQPQRGDLMAAQGAQPWVAIQKRSRALKGRQKHSLIPFTTSIQQNGF